MKLSFCTLGFFALTAVALPALAQVNPSVNPFPTSTSTPVSTDNPEASGLDRWVDMKNVSFSLRYRNVADTEGTHEYEQGSQRSILDGKFKFDAAEKYSINFHISSGHYFDWAYADFAGGGLDKAISKTEVGMQPGDLQNLQSAFVLYPDQTVGIRSGGWGLAVRRLFLDAKPVKGLELQVGSLDIDRGYGSEITTYDEDGYIDGERISLKDPKHLYFDQVSFTYAYLGDLFQANFFERTGRMTQGNYRQYMVRKSFGRRVDASADFTDTRNTQTVREAAFVKIPEAKVIDAVRVEAYQRLADATFYNFDFASGSGYAITGFKNFRKHLTLEGGLANLDWGYDVYTHMKIAAILGYSVNGDGYNTGQHWFVRPTVHISKEFSASAFYSRMFNYNYDADGYLWNKSNLQVGLGYNFTDLFHRGLL